MRDAGQIKASTVFIFDLVLFTVSESQLTLILFTIAVLIYGVLLYCSPSRHGGRVGLMCGGERELMYYLPLERALLIAAGSQDRKFRTGGSQLVGWSLPSAVCDTVCIGRCTKTFPSHSLVFQ